MDVKIYDLRDQPLDGLRFGKLIEGVSDQSWLALRKAARPMVGHEDNMCADLISEGVVCDVAMFAAEQYDAVLAAVSNKH